MNHKRLKFSLVWQQHSLKKMQAQILLEICLCAIVKRQWILS